ncbi:MAG: nicotinate (nicotinamide) nucleotide adenylyltransferase [Treponema sp.]|nr:nicotinate (nicotinamide) nucleotide adenylyltransferase [Treponema sp.]
MKIAMLGGSFNPVHLGHLFLADTALADLGYDRIILVPAYQSPFKIGADAASPADRLEMLAASIPGDPRLTIDDCEIRREGVSFTIDTIHEVIARYKPDGKPGLIMGDDLAGSFEQWQKHDEIAELADIIIARRLNDAGNSAVERFPYPYKDLNNEIMNISSRIVREKISSGGNWRYLVPSGARYLIENRNLYGLSPSAGISAADTSGADAADGGKKPAAETFAQIIVNIENCARSILTAPRFHHSRSVALMAWDLCRRFALDAQRGYLAGIAHDLCKQMSEDELVRLAHSDGGGSSKIEQEKPGLLHARAAAVLLRSKYGIADEDILEAIRCHTTANWNMGNLAKVVYIADKIEVTRPGVDPELRDMIGKTDLDTLFQAVFNNTVAHLKSREINLSYGTKRLLAAMHKRNNL